MFSVVEIEINSNCNMSCSYCPNGYDERVEKGQMSFESFSLIIDQLKSINFEGKVSYHFYNEPLLHKDLDKFVLYTKKQLKNVVIDLYTNGTMLTQEKFETLIESGVDKFTITKHEGISNSYIFDKTYSKLSEDQKKRVKYLGHEDLELSNRGGLLENIENKYPKGLPCFIPLYHVVITLRGNVLPCYDDFYQTLTMGNVFDNSLSEIWNSEKYQEFRSRLRKKNGRMTEKVCSKCSNYKFL